MKNRVSYNLPGYGKISAHLYDYTKSVSGILEKFGHIDRLKNINQLGPIVRVYPGAHHTKYEYVIAQMSLITELCYLRGIQPEEFRLSTRVDDFGSFSWIDKNPSKGDILQTLVFLTSIGHLPGTFATERAFLHHLRNKTKARRAFRRGLPKECRDRFDDILESFDIYKLNQYISLFLISRYKRAKNGKEIVPFCIDILKYYIEDYEGSNNLKIIWSLFESTRKLTYLAIDSLYTEVPFSLDLSSIFLSLEDYRREVLAERSNFQEALERLEGVLRDSVYMSPKSLLQQATCSEHALNIFGLFDTEGKISEMRKLLEATPNNDRKFGDAILKEESYSERHKILSIYFDSGKAVEGDIIEGKNSVKWESKKRKNAGLSYSRFGAEWDPTRRHLRISSGIRYRGKKSDEERAFRVAREICKSEIEISNSLDLKKEDRYDNQENILDFLCRSVWGWGKKYQFRDDIIEGEYPLYIVYGSTEASKRLNNYIDELTSMEYDEDNVFEMHLLRDQLREISYRGLLICYAGSLVVANKTDEEAEFDGAIFFLGKESEGRRAILAEAKNIRGQSSPEAEKSLNQKINNLEMDNNRLEVTHCEGGALMSLFPGE